MMRLHEYRCGRYEIEADLHKAFVIRSIRLNGHNLLDARQGLYFTVTAGGREESSLSLSADPEVYRDGDRLKAAFSTGSVEYKVILDFAAESFQLYVTRTFREDLEVEQQGCPVLLLRQDAVENLRWTRSGANFWVGGKGDGIRGFLSAHKGYDPEKNITRTMEDIGFCLMGPEEEGADVLHVLGNCHADHTASGNFAATVGRWPYGNSRPLRLAVTIAEQRLEYATGEPGGWPGRDSTRTGKIRPQNEWAVFKPQHFARGSVQEISLLFRPEPREDWYDLGQLCGVNQHAVTRALHNYGRLMIMDHNFGTAQENPYNFFEVPAAQQHWNTNLVSVMRDDAAVETQKNGLRVIRDHLQDPANGHIWSPYVGVKEDNWGHDYADMQLAYNIAVCEMYSITGDRAFAGEMRQSAEASMAYALQRYYDPQRRAVICVHTDDWYNTKPHNDYWEKSRGEYNGYLTAMLYEALVWMEKLERLVYEDAKKAADYRRVAEEIRVQFNKPLDEGGFWSPESKTYFTGTRNLDIRYLPVQGSALKSGLVPRERAKALVASVEKDHAVFNLGFHVMNVRHMNDLTRPASQSNDCTMSMLGENGGWYGAPDADFYAGLPVYGDRGRLLWYINGMAEKFDITGFVGATTYMRDGVTPADYGWNSCMPDMAQPVWGLFTYGYGFQPDIGRLVIAPFLHPAMNGTTAKYRWCRADIAVQYHTPYAFTVTASAFPQPVVIRFLNQTPGKTYAVQTDAERLERTADADGNVDVPMAHLQGTFTLCDPDEEIRPDEGNLALDRPAKASTTLHGELFTRHWSEKLTDGRVDNGFWTHEPEDLTPYAAVDFGMRTAPVPLRVYAVREDTYYYRVWGSDDPMETDWTLLEDHWDDGVPAGGEVPLTAHTGGWQKIKVEFDARRSGPVQLAEITAGTVPDGISGVAAAAAHDPEEDIAFGRPVTVSSEYREGLWAREYAVDGRRETDNLSHGWSSAMQGDPARSEWIQVDLQAAYLVDRVVLGPRASLWTESFYFPLCYRIETSLDGKDWQTVVRVEDSPRPECHVTHVFTPTAARYVRLFAERLRYEPKEDAAACQLAEFEVYARQRIEAGKA